MKLNLILLIIISSVVTYGSQTDSILQTVSGVRDSVKIRVLLENSWKFRSSNPTEAIKLAMLARNLSNKNDFLTLEAKSLNFLGVIYTNTGMYQKALELHQQALIKAEEAGDWMQIGYSNNNLGGVYLTTLNIDRGLKYVQKAIKIFNQHEYQQGIAYCFIYLGRIYRNQGNYHKSIEYFNKSADIRRKIHDTEGMVMVLLDIAKLQVQMKEYKNALATYSKMKKMVEEVDYIKGKAEVDYELSSLYLNLKDFNKSRMYALKALEINKKILNASGEISALNQLALIYASDRNFTKGGEYLNYALEKSKSIKDSMQIANCYLTSYKFYKIKGDPVTALTSFEDYSELRETILSSEESTKLGEMESINTIEMKEQENQLLQQDLNNQKKYLTIIIILFFFIAAILIFRFIENKKVNKKLKELNNVKDNFFSIIAHDLRGPFNALLGTVELLRTQYNELSDEEKNELICLISSSVKSSYDLTENLLLWAEAQKNSLNFEPHYIILCDLLEHNIELVRTNLANKRIILSYECSPQLKVFADQQMLNAIIRNLIYNAIKFTPKGGRIKIRASQCDDRVNIGCEDNGIGMDEKTIRNLFKSSNKMVFTGTDGEKGSGLGLILISQFVEKHHGTIKVDSVLSKGSTFTISLPFKELTN